MTHDYLVDNAHISFAPQIKINVGLNAASFIVSLVHFFKHEFYEKLQVTLFNTHMTPYL